jgi:hypothetical protein
MGGPEFMADLEELATRSPEARERIKRLQARLQSRLAAAVKANAAN